MEINANAMLISYLTFSGIYDLGCSIHKVITKREKTPSKENAEWNGVPSTFETDLFYHLPKKLYKTLSRKLKTSS